jgi:hypothetical protein
MKRAVMFLVGLLPIANGCTQPSDLYQRATVTMVDNQACVSVTSDSGDAATPTKLAGLTLSRVSGERAEAVWELGFTGAAEPFFLSPGGCLQPVPHVARRWSKCFGSNLSQGSAMHLPLRVPLPLMSQVAMAGRLVSTANTSV